MIVDVIELAMKNLEKNGVRREDTMEYLINQGKTTHDPPLTDEERKRLRENEITRDSIATRNEVNRIYIKHFAKRSVSGIDGEKLGNVLIECHDNQLTTKYKCPKYIEKETGIDKETAKQIAHVVLTQAQLFTDWTFAKEKKYDTFSMYSPYDNKYDGQEFTIEDFPKYVGFMVENNASPNFHRKGKEFDEIRSKIRLRKV